MGLMAKDDGGGSGFTPVPQGTHIARCVTVCDLGVQHTPWGNKEQVYLGFEVPGERVKWTDKDGNEKEGAALVGATWTISLFEEANLGKNLISWRGKPFTEEEKKGFDLFNLLGVPCMLSITHNTSQKNGKTYANINSIMGVPKGTEIPPQENESIGYTATDPRFANTLDKLPEWLKNRALDGQRQNTVPDAPPAPPPATESTFDDDIPF